CVIAQYLALALHHEAVPKPKESIRESDRVEKKLGERNKHTDTDMHTHTNTQTQTHRHTDTHTHKHAPTDTHKHAPTDTYSHIHRDCGQNGLEEHSPPS